jgi:hypothetical protein
MMAAFAPAAAAAQTPRVDAVTVVGAARTRPGVVVDLTRLSKDDELTGRERMLAERRLRQLPIARDAVLRYVLQRDGRVEMQAIIDEKSLLPVGSMDWGGVAARAILKDEIKLDIGGPAGRGELWSAAWRWSENRPRVMFGVAAPVPGMPGVVSIDGLVEEAAYAEAPTTAADGIFREGRERAAVAVSDWLTNEIRWKSSVAFDRISERRHLAVDVAFDVRLMEDLLAPGFTIGTWRSLDGTAPFSSTDLSLAWRSDRSPLPPFSGLVGVTLVSDDAPLAIWPAAGTGGSGRGALLRAHPLHEHGIVTSENFARRLMYFTVEHQRPLAFGPAGKTAVVAFLDAGRAWGGLPGRPRRVNVDIGTGVRYGSDSGMVRFDVAFGLRDQQWAVSAGWVDAWPWR